jgi:tRNA dimethylallyltransferase
LQKTCLILTGPTASGKTALAIELAKHFNTAIISADSRQCFKEMTIGVAKPSEAELTQAPHYFIGTHSIHEEMNTALFERYALDVVEKLFQQHDVVVMAGGTGLYIKAFCEGIDAIPEVPEALRAELAQQYEANGIAWLRAQVQQHDPLYWSTGEIQNPHRLLRALEVKLTSGQSIRQFQQGGVMQRNFRIVQCAYTPDRETLYARINQRVLQMMRAGLLAEVQALYPHRHLKALQTVGYQELFAYFDGAYDLDRAVELIQQNTRHYAKRQLTWFRKNKELHWLDVPTVAEVLRVMESPTGNFTSSLLFNRNPENDDT